MLEVSMVQVVPDIFLERKYALMLRFEELHHFDLSPEPYELEFRLNMLLRLVQERKRVHEQDQFRAGLMLTFIFMCAVLLLLASVAYDSMLVTGSAMFDNVLPRLSPKLIQQARHFWILGGIVPKLIIVLTVALSALTLARIRQSTRTRVQDEVLRTYRKLVVQNGRSHQERERFG